MSDGAAGSGSPVRVGEEGEGGGLSTLRTIAAAWPPPTPMPRALAARICSVTEPGRGVCAKRMEGLEGPSLEAGILRGRMKGGAFIIAQPPPKEHSLIRKIVTHSVTQDMMSHTHTHTTALVSQIHPGAATRTQPYGGHRSEARTDTQGHSQHHTDK